MIDLSMIVPDGSLTGSVIRVSMSGSEGTDEAYVIKLKKQRGKKISDFLMPHSAEVTWRISLDH